MAEVEKQDAFTFAKKATQIPIPGNKVIEEFVGLLNSGTNQVSVAKMVAPPGWGEPPQTPEFDEITIVTSGKILVEIKEKAIEVQADQPFIAHKNNKIRYSNPFDTPAEYWAICIPAFSNETVNREND